MTDKQLEPITRQFRYIFYALFQPVRLTREFQPVLLWQRSVFMLKLVFPIFIVVYPFALVGEAILFPFGLLRYTDAPSILLVPMRGIAAGVGAGIVVGIVYGIAGGIAVGIVYGIAGGIAVGIVYGVAVGITGGIVGGIAVGIVYGIAVGITGGITRGIVYGLSGNMTRGIGVGIVYGVAGGIAVGVGVNIVYGIAVGMTGGIVYGIGIGIVYGIAVGITGGITGGIVYGIGVGIARGVAGGIAGGIAVGIVYGIVGGIRVGIIYGIVGGITGGIATIIGIYRVPLYFISGPSALYAYLASRRRPRVALRLLCHSSLHWDERVYLPLPFLKQTLLIACDQDLQGTLEEIAFIAAERPQQLRAARAVVLEVVMRDLEGRETIQEIAGAVQRLNELLPPETKLSNPRWANALPRLSDASREMMRSMQPIGQQARLKSLEKVIKNLDKIRPNVAFTDQALNRRLKQVIETWRVAAQQESERLKHAAQDIGNIDNPYKPGQVLELDDPLFVGRRDLAVQLEYALSKGSRRPTLLLQGERRMGKTSTLLQLSHLLGTSYIPVVYNLQDPKIYARITTFLGTLANGIYDELIKRGIRIKRLPFALLQESIQPAFQHVTQAVAGVQQFQGRDPVAYDTFDHWLREVEEVLEKEDRSLLLAFDEFEKLDEAGEKGYLDLPLFLDWCRQVIQYHPHIILLFSGVRTFSSMGERTGLNWSNYFVNVQTLKVSFLNNDEARHLVLHPRPDYPGEGIFGAVVEQIIQQTNCHPFLVQALCSQLIDTLNVEKRERVEVDDVVRAVKQVVESWDGYFDDLWKRCDEAQRACLLALDAQEGEEGMTLGAVQQRSQLEEKSMRQVLRTLVSRDLVVDNEDGTYRIAAPIFRRWVKHNS